MSYIKKSWIKNADQRKDMLKYQRWFDDCSSLDDCIKNGFIDFTHKIFTTDFYKIIGNPKNKKCLEIGCGGGRLLNAACKFFEFSYGVDILNDECIDRTSKFLTQNNSQNFKILNRSSVDKIPNSSVDFLYSFIVFQHFDSWDEVDFYFKLINRVLSKDGAAVIHFGKLATSNKSVLITSDKNFNDRECSLFVSEEFASNYIDKKGFKIIESGDLTKTPWTDKRSGQFYVKFKR